jgi:hypothetical protein
MRDLSKLVDQLSRLTLGEASELRKMLETQWVSRQSRKTRMRFTKARGLTASEKVLAELCERSFLSLWSYPNLFRKQAKELIDLIVIFGDDLILFSDKSCAFPDGGDAELDWERWFRRSITKSAAQITQAEDWIKRQPERVYGCAESKAYKNS